ncbi:ATP-binding protein [Coleofasciculus sp. F4-SAH-05]|uniref:ATP-binding protein n=1 Tax=Coleofasciculus sp. F4-SAH-05 TaxID=3069525 RepID=UPI003302ED38
MISEQYLSEIDTATMARILVVEDERIIALNLKENLEALGYGVVGIAASGNKAVTQAGELHPDLVLMDIWLQGDMDGIWTAQQIWNKWQIPVIYLTGHSDKITLKRAKVTAPFGYILKPVNEQQLSVAIEIALQRYKRDQFLSAVLWGIDDGVIVVDQDCRIQCMNQVAELLTEWQFADAKNRELKDVFQIIDVQTQQPVNNSVTLAFKEDRLVDRTDDHVLITKTGQQIVIADSAAPIWDNQGDLAGVVLVFQDIRDRKQAEAALRQQLAQEQQLNQFQQQFIHTVSHEYRTPLSIIQASTFLIETDSSSVRSENKRVNCQRIKQAVKYMVGLLEDVLTFGQAEAGQLLLDPMPLDVNLFCQQLIDEYQLIASDQAKITWSSCGKSQTAYLDQKILQLIVRNLLTNALKYSPENSSVYLTLTCEDDRLTVEVKDNGIGIPPEDQPCIFEPFRRASNTGTVRGSGMGLAIVKKAVDLHGGTLSVESVLGIGTRFTVVLPFPE